MAEQDVASPPSGLHLERLMCALDRPDQIDCRKSRMLSEAHSLVMQRRQDQGIVAAEAVFQTLVDFFQMSLAVRPQGPTDLARVSTEMFRFREEVYGFHCSAGFG